MDKGLLVVDEVGVRDPQLICHSVVQGEVEGDAGVGEALVSPGLLEVHGDSVVLQERPKWEEMDYTAVFNTLFWVSKTTDTTKFHLNNYGKLNHVQAFIQPN